jgi:hypothetical protein
MAAIEFIRIHVLRMGNEDFDKFFCRQFPTVTRYIMTKDEMSENENDKQEIKMIT